MPTELRINSLSDIQPAIDRLLDSPDEQFLPVFTEDLVFTIKLEGRSWDGLIDVRVARYVQELQQTVNRARREAGPEIGERPLVKVRVKEGSTDLETKAVELVEKIVGNMSSTQQFVTALVIIGCVFGAFALRAILRHLDERHRRQLAHNTQDSTTASLAQVAKLAIERIDPEKPVRTLINGMQPGDTIKLPAERQPLSKAEARERYPRRPSITPVDVNIDGEYHVISLALERPIRLTLESGEHTFKAELSPNLGADDQAAFLAKVKAAIESGSSVRVALQISAVVKDDAVVGAMIVGIGKAARETAKPLSDVLG